jgi:phosphate transport system substrate-binding protein
VAANRPGAAPSPEDEFRVQATAAGLALPPKTRVNPWIAVATVGLLLGGSIAVGDITGWGIGPVREAGLLGLYGPQHCVIVPSYLAVYLSGGVSSEADPAITSALGVWASEFTNWTGDCVHLEASASTGDGYVPDLSGDRAVFAASEVAPTASDRAALGATVNLVPVAAAPVGIVYNLPGVSEPLRLNGSILAGMYDGTVRSWDDPAIAALNPGARLSGAPAVTPVYRSDPSEANLAVTSFFARQAPSWNSSVGVGAQVNWPVGVGASSANQMGRALAGTPGAVGYLEAGVGLPQNASWAEVENPAGAFVLPTPANASAAAGARSTAPAATAEDWANVSLVDAPGAASYPIVQLVYFAVYLDLGQAYGGHLSGTNATWMLSFFWWLVADAPGDVNALGFGSLPTAFVPLTEGALEKALYDGTPLVETGEGTEGGTTDEF